MSRGEVLSVLGLYKHNDHLFDEMVYPSGFTAADKQTVIGNILAECAELEILFPNYDTCKTMIGLWSKFNVATWTRIYTASKLEYNPIENYNRTELETIVTDGKDQHSGADENRHTGTDTQTVQSQGTASNTGTDTSRNAITAYDSTDLYTHDETQLNHGHTVTDTSTGSNSTQYGKIDIFNHGEIIEKDESITRNNHTSGNIGITTSQQMLEQEIDISAKLNIFKIICDSFKERFCLLVY